MRIKGYALALVLALPGAAAAQDSRLVERLVRAEMLDRILRMGRAARSEVGRWPFCSMRERAMSSRCM